MLRVKLPLLALTCDIIRRVLHAPWNLEVGRAHLFPQAVVQGVAGGTRVQVIDCILVKIESKFVEGSALMGIYPDLFSAA